VTSVARLKRVSRGFIFVLRYIYKTLFKSGDKMGGFECLHMLDSLPA